jgi:hypothetical protein
MNTLQNVYNKLADKTELAKHEVELAIIDELVSLTKVVNDTIGGFNKTNEILIKEARMAVTQATNAQKEFQKVDKILMSMKKQFADLGLNYLDNANVKTAVALVEKVRDINQLAGYIKQIIK